MVHRFGLAGRLKAGALELEGAVGGWGDRPCREWRLLLEQPLLELLVAGLKRAARRSVRSRQYLPSL